MGRYPVIRPRALLITVSFLPILTGCGSLPRSHRSTMSFEESVIFHPQRDEGDGPTSSRVSAEDVWFSTPDQIRLNGRFAEAERPRAIVLFAEGNAGNIASRDWVLRLFRDKLGASVLIFDYRGYGRSEGIPSEAGVLSDARAARRWLAQRTGVAEGEIVLVGESLGGAVMVDLAAKDGAGGLILQNTFSSLPDVASSHLPLLPVRFLMTTRLDSARKIAQYHGPLLQTHGDADRVVPFALGRRLFDAANEPKRFVRVSGGDHNDPPSREFLDALDEFLGLLPSPETSRRVQ